MVSYGQEKGVENQFLLFKPRSAMMKYYFNGNTHKNKGVSHRSCVCCYSLCHWSCNTWEGTWVTLSNPLTDHDNLEALKREGWGIKPTSLQPSMLLLTKKNTKAESESTAMHSELTLPAFEADPCFGALRIPNSHLCQGRRTLQTLLAAARC